MLAGPRGAGAGWRLPPSGCACAGFHPASSLGKKSLISAGTELGAADSLHQGSLCRAQSCLLHGWVGITHKKHA